MESRIFELKLLCDIPYYKQISALQDPKFTLTFSGDTTEDKSNSTFSLIQHVIIYRWVALKLGVEFDRATTKAIGSVFPSLIYFIFILIMHDYVVRWMLLFACSIILSWCLWSFIGTKWFRIMSKWPPTVTYLHLWYIAQRFGIQAAPLKNNNVNYTDMRRLTNHSSGHLHKR